MGTRRCISGMKVPCSHVIVLYPVIEVSGKVERLNTNRTANTPDFSRMKVWLTPPVKNYDLQSSLLRPGRIWNGLWEKVGINTRYSHLTSCRQGL